MEIFWIKYKEKGLQNLLIVLIRDQFANSFKYSIYFLQLVLHLRIFKKYIIFQKNGWIPVLTTHRLAYLLLLEYKHGNLYSRSNFYSGTQSISTSGRRIGTIEPSLFSLPNILIFKGIWTKTSKFWKGFGILLFKWYII